MVGIVVLNWFGRNRTLDCLRAVAQLSYSERFVALLDNGCREFSREEIDRLVPGGLYLQAPENLGFAGGCNLAARHAIERGAQFLWFLNNDALPDSEALGELVAASGEATVAGAKILFRSDPSRIDSVAVDVQLDRGRLLLRGHNEIDRGQHDALDEVTAVTGCAMLVSRGVFERLGGFDESYFAYVEDVDFCLRARASGHHVRFVPGARVLHDRAPATCGRQSVESLYYATRNHLMLVARHRPLRGAAEATRWVRIVSLNLLFALRSGSNRARRVRAVLRGAIDFHRGVRGRQVSH